MCLYINPEVHQRNSEYPEPKRVTKDITVYKVVFEDSVNNAVMTPFQNTKIVFSEGKCILPMFTKGRFKQIYQLGRRVMSKGVVKTIYYKKEFGYHSYANSTRAFLIAEHCRICYAEGLGGKYTVLKAIIPKGSWVWYGESYDICSNQLIIISK